MSGVVNAAKEVTGVATDLAQQTSDWATKAISDNSANIGKYTDQLVSDSDTARGMIDNFQNVANKQLGLADGASDIGQAAMTQATKQGAIQDTQLGVQQDQLAKQNQQLGNQQGQLDIQQGQLGVQDEQKQVQQKQLGVEDTQLANQKDQLGLQQDFRDDQQAQQAKADQLFDQYSQTYAPAQAQFMADAEAYDTPEKRAAAGASAQAGVGMQFQAARDAATRQLESFGVKPSDTRFAALDLGTRIKEAAAKAAADRAAQLQTEQTGFSLRDEAIKQGAGLPGASSTQAGVANQAGSNVIGQGNVANATGSLANAAGANANAAGANVVGAGNTAVGAGNTAAAMGNTAVGFGSDANQAGANAVGAGNAATGAINAATGANNSAISATSGATQANTGALAANAAGATETGAAGTLADQGLSAETGAAGAAAPFVNAATSGVNSQTAADKANYDNQIAQFKAESTNTSGLGALAGTLAGPLLKAGLAGATGGASLMPDIAGQAFGGTASSPAAGLTASDYGAGASLKDAYGFAEGGAIPMSASPSQGGQTDDVKAMLNAGEFIVPKDVASWYGEKFFQQLIAKAQNEKTKAQAKPAIGPMPPGPAQVASGPSAGAI